MLSKIQKLINDEKKENNNRINWDEYFIIELYLWDIMDLYQVLRM